MNLVTLAVKKKRRAWEERANLLPIFANAEWSDEALAKAPRELSAEEVKAVALHTLFRATRDHPRQLTWAVKEGQKEIYIVARGTPQHLTIEAYYENHV